MGDGEGQERRHVTTTEEVVTAVLAMTQADSAQLRAYAVIRVRGAGRAACGQSWQDLLQEAITQTLEGRRRWDATKVGLVAYLVGAMRSISSAWRERFETAGRMEPFLESEISDSLSADGLSLFATIPTSRLDPGSEAEVRNDLEAIYQGFRKDPLVRGVLDGLSEGLTAKDVCMAQGIEMRDYDAAMHRLRRGLAKIFPVGR